MLKGSAITVLNRSKKHFSDLNCSSFKTKVFFISIRALLHQVSESMQSQRCIDASLTTVVEINGNKWSHLRMACYSFWKDSILFNESCVASVIVALKLTLGVNGPLRIQYNVNMHLGLVFEDSPVFGKGVFWFWFKTSC